MHIPIVWQLVPCYLPRSETFIYTVINNLRQAKAVIVNYGELLNESEFPVGSRPLYCLRNRLKFPRYITGRVIRRITGKDWVERAHRREYEEIAKSHFPDVIHAHFGGIGYLALEAKRTLGVPLVTTFYGYDTNPHLDSKNWPAQRKQLFDEGDLFLAEGPFMQSSLVAQGCLPDRVRIQRIGIDLTKMPAIRNKGLREVPVILFAARFVEKKGLEYGLDAVGKLHRAGYKFECRVIGSGPLEQNLHRLARTGQVEGLVQFLGSMSHSQYLEELASAGIFVQPSVTAANGDTEGGAPTSILEAQACGVPVVATTHADIPNVVLRDQSAVLVEERNSEALANALAALLERPQDWSAMGRAGSCFVEKNHSAARLAKSLEGTYASYCR